MKRRAVAILLLSALVFSLVNSSSVSAVVNGKPVVGTDYAVTIFLSEKGNGFCTGIYFSPRVVITAAHCVVIEEGKAGEWRTSIENLYVSHTGIDWSDPSSISKRSKVLKIWVDPNYFNRYKPELSEVQTQKNDIAFLFLDEPLAGKHLDRSASQDETNEFRLGKIPATHIGYGCIGSIDGNVIANDGKPYRLDGVTGTTRTDPSKLNSNDVYLGLDYPFGTSLCPGDSGSGLYFEREGKAIFLATIFAGGGWQSAAQKDVTKRGEAGAIAFWTFKETYEIELRKFLDEERELRESITLKKQQVQQVRKLAEENGSFYREQTGCHARGVNAELQILENGIWRSLVAAQGWDETCDLKTSPVQPWAIADVPPGSLLRWRIWSPGSWDVSTEPFQETTSRFRELKAEAKAAAELKAKQEAEAKAAAELKAKQEAEAKAKADAAKKKSTITCIKGKTVKKVNAVNPKCPSGYKKK
jgi:hypothetical protein